MCAISCLLTPILAYQGWEYVTLLRLLNGLGASAILPVMVHLIELWMPGRENSLGLSIMLFVQSIVFTLSPLISGYLAEIHWKWAFYVPAIAALIFCIIWPCLVTDFPADCWLVSQQELDHISKLSDIIGDDKSSSSRDDNEKSQQRSNNSRKGSQDSQIQVSWTKALKVKSFYALVAVWIFYQSSFGSFSFLIPSYMRQVLKVPIMENGMLCFIIQAGCMVSVIWPQPILIFLQCKCGFSLTGARRVVLSFSKLIPTRVQSSKDGSVANRRLLLVCFVVITTWLLVAQYHEYQVVLFALNRIFHLSTDTIVTSTIMSQFANTGASSIVYSVINAIGNLSTVFFCMLVGFLLDLSVSTPSRLINSRL